MELSRRVINALERAGINWSSPREISQFSGFDLWRKKGIGVKAIREIVIELHKDGLSLKQSNSPEWFYESIMWWQATRDLASPPVSYPSGLRSLPIENLELGVRSYNSLKKAGISVIGQIVNLTPEDFKNLYIGGRSQTELQEALRIACLT